MAWSYTRTFLRSRSDEFAYTVYTLSICRWHMLFQSASHTDTCAQMAGPCPRRHQYPQVLSLMSTKQPSYLARRQGRCLFLWHMSVQSNMPSWCHSLQTDTSLVPSPGRGVRWSAPSHTSRSGAETQFSTLTLLGFPAGGNLRCQFCGALCNKPHRFRISFSNRCHCFDNRI